MGQLTIYKDTESDSTIISNRFIDEYMKDANDAQLKVYLYLIRMLSSNYETSISDIADKFNHTEKDVIRALKYWEKNQLLSMEYDGSKNLIGIHLKDIDKKTAAEPLRQAVTIQTTAIPKAASVSNTQPQKTDYSLDELKAFKEQEETAQLLFIVESYIGKPLSPSEIQSVFFIYDKLNFSVDLIDCLIQYCVDNNKKSFHYIEKIAINWSAENITTPKQAKSYQTKYNKTVYSIMKALGKSGDPTPKEKEFILTWTKDMAFPLEIVLEACNRATLQTDKGRFPYANQILTSWKASGVRNLTDISALDTTYQKSKSSPAAGRSSANNKFNDMMQNNYNFSELEKELLHN